MARWSRRFATVLLSLAGVYSACATPGAAQQPPLSPRIANYRISARLDSVKKTLDGTETLTYRNLTGQALDTFPFHLYLNAFQPKSTFMREARQGKPDSRWDDKSYGAIEIKSFEVVGVGDVTAQLRFIHPDDDNADDRTVVEVKLPAAVPADAEVQFKIAFHATLPEVVERTGYRRNFFMIGQWFPKIGVWWRGGWNCHQYHSSTEFFADFGVYDVQLTVPENFLLGASGIELGTVKNRDGTKTVSFRGEDIHDFAWAADPSFRIVEDTFSGSAGVVKIRLLMQPGNFGQAGRYLLPLKGTMEWFERNIGPYPYPQITVVDPAPGAGGAGGMEYPMLFTGGTTWWMPKALLWPEVTAEHEFGHNYWQGMVATNEFEEAWLDEGINSYCEVKVMDHLYGSDTSMINGRLMSIGDSGFRRWGYLGLPDADPMPRPGWKFMSSRSYGVISYDKSAMALLTLEQIIGEETLLRALRTYFLRYRFTHPTTQDFLKTVEDISGRDLRWFFDQAVYGTQVLDYEVLKISSYPRDSTKGPSKEKKDETVYVSTVLLHRKGDFVFPVEVEVKFDNGDAVREQWDGRDRWVRFTYEKKAKVVSAEIDPGHKLWLDRDFYNNSRTTDPQTGAARKLRVYWILVAQFLMQLLAWLV